MKAKHKLFICLIFILILFTINQISFANSIEESNIELSENQIVINTNNEFMPFTTTSKKHNGSIKRFFSSLANALNSNLPESYKTEGLTIKNQESTGECWAFAFTSAFEAKDIKVGAEKKVYSPRHMDYSCSKSFNDINDFSNFFERETTEAGGNYYLATAYSASGKGPVLEDDMPFQNNVTQKISYNDLNAKVQKQLDKTIIFDSIYKKHQNGTVTYYSDINLLTQYTQSEVNNIRNKIKEQIQTNGSVGTSVYEDDNSKDLCKTSINQSPNGQANHAVLIVGWDDDYQAAEWTTKGAYIAQNSYGVERFDNGYIYISYDDVFVEMNLMGVAESSEIDYEKVYEYDQLGSTSVITSSSLRNNVEDNYDNSEISAINIFPRDISKKEEITEIGISLWSYEKVEVYLTETFSTNGLPINFTKVVDLTETLEPGFCTLQLKENVVLSKDKFAICVRYIQDNAEGIATAAIERRVSNIKWWNNVTGNAGESYFVDVFNQTGSNKYWTMSDTNPSTGEVYYLNASIKAYTKSYEEPEQVVSSDVYKVNMEEKNITRVPVETEIHTFKSKIITNQEYKILDKNNDEVTDGNMKTGYKIKFDTEEYTISVISDINGDGIVDILDLARLRSHLVGRNGYILKRNIF